MSLLLFSILVFFPSLGTYFDFGHSISVFPGSCYGFLSEDSNLYSELVFSSCFFEEKIKTHLVLFFRNINYVSVKSNMTSVSIISNIFYIIAPSHPFLGLKKTLSIMSFTMFLIV